MIVASTTALYASVTECPKLDTKNTSKEQLEYAEGLLTRLDTFSDMKKIYLDVLKKYNNTDIPELYVNSDELKILGTTEIWATLLALDVLDDKENYKKVLNTIDSNNPKWCELSSYEKQLKAVK